MTFFETAKKKVQTNDGLHDSSCKHGIALGFTLLDLLE